MKIPIFNTLYQNTKTTIKSKKLNLLSLNNLNFNEVNLSKFPSVKILKMIPQKISLFETVLVSANDELVDLFLNKKIHFMKIYTIIKKILNLKEFSKYKYLYPKNVDQIYELDKYVRLKTKSFCIDYHK
jgi:1-deoxy-D-xylulose-5-phosphate reductoisomerase